MNEAIFPNILKVAVWGYILPQCLYLFIYIEYFFPDKEMKKKLNATNKLDFIL